MASGNEYDLDGEHARCDETDRFVPWPGIRRSSPSQRLNEDFSSVSRQNYLFTSESVSEGHPDKVCDRISDEIVDLFFKEAVKGGLDPSQVRVAAETLATTNRVVIAGEVRTNLDAKQIKSKVKSVARKAIRNIGYEQDGFHWKKAKIDVLLHPQSADIAQGVDEASNKDVGAGDQGIMFGYATRSSRCWPRPVMRVRATPPSSAPTPRARSPSNTRTASRSA
jgi:hypothetical protein